MTDIYFPEGFLVTTLSADLNATATTINLSAVPDTVTKGYLVIEPEHATKREVVHFTSVGATSVTSADDTTDATDASGRGCLGSITAGGVTAHSSGVTVIMAAVEQYWARMYTGIVNNHNVDGSHKTLTDSNGNEWFGVGVTSSAVNYLKTTNAATGNAPTAEASGDDTDIDLDVKPKGAGKVNLYGTDINLPGTNPNIQVGDADPTRTIIVPAGSMKPTTTAGCASSATVEAGTNDVDYVVLDFDKDSDESAFMIFAMPDSWDGGTVTWTPIWTTAGTTGNVVFSIKGRAYANDDAIDQAYGTAVTSDDTFIAAGDVHIGPASGAMTFAGAPAGGQLVQVKITRDVSEDNLNADARLIALKMEYKCATYSD